MARRYAAVVAPIFVLAVLLIQGVTTPGYDPVRQTISELGTGLHGTGIIAFYGVIVAACVWEPMAKTLGLRISVAALITALLSIAIGCTGIGWIGAEPWPWNSMTWQGRLHLICAFVFVFAAIPFAYLAASRALPAAWRGLRAASAALSVGSLALFVITLVALDGSPPNAYVASHLGLIERIYVFSFLVWQCIVSASVARSTPNAR